MSALAAEVAPDHQGIDLSGLLVLEMAAIAQDAGLAPLVARIRPSWRDRYPPIAIDRYATRTASTQLMPPIRWLPGQTETGGDAGIVSGSRWRPGRHWGGCFYSWLPVSRSLSTAWALQRFPTGGGAPSRFKTAAMVWLDIPA